MFYTYVLKSINHKRFYFGHTKDLEYRLAQHNAGKVRSTKAFRPWKHHYVESFNSRADAFNREMFFKSVNGRIWLKENGII